MNMVFLTFRQLMVKYYKKKIETKGKLKIGDQYHYLRWLLGLSKLMSPKKVEILQVVIVLRVASWKITIFIMEERTVFFLHIFTIKLSSTSLSYLDAHSTLNFFRTFLIFLNINTDQTSKEQDLNFIKSSHLLWEHHRELLWK